jgi:hypothetical protein
MAQAEATGNAEIEAHLASKKNIFISIFSGL